MHARKKVADRCFVWNDSIGGAEVLEEHVVYVRSSISEILDKLKEPMESMSISRGDIVAINVCVIRMHLKGGKNGSVSQHK